MLPACAGGPQIPEKSSRPYSGPPVTLESGSPQHRVILTAPTGGWSFRLDQTIQRFEHTDVFLTLIQPNPAFMQAQVQVRHEAGTGIDPAIPIAPFVRILTHDEPPGSQPYSAVPTR